MKSFLKHIVVIVLIVLATLYVVDRIQLKQEKNSEYGAVTVGSDKERIKGTVNNFVKAFNDGELDGVLSCMTKKARRKAKVDVILSFKFIDWILSWFHIPGFGTDMVADLWGYGAVKGELYLAVESIKFVDSTHANVKLRVSYNYGKPEIVATPFVKEGEGWYFS